MLLLQIREFMTENEIIPAETQQVEQVQDIEIVEFTRGEENHNRPYMEAVNNDFNKQYEEQTQVDPTVQVDNKEVVAPVEEKVVAPITQEVDVYKTLTEKHGRTIDEEYLSTDWREKATLAEKTLESSKEKIESFKHIFENKDLLQIADLMKNGHSAKDILESMAIEPDKIPSDQLIIDYIRREKPFLSKEDIELFAEQNYGVGEDLAELKLHDPQRYFQLIENIDKATSVQKQFLSDRKLSLLNTPTVATQPNSDNLITVEKVKDYKSSLGNHLESLKEIKVSDDYSKAYDKAKLQEVSDNIVFSGDLGDNKNVVMLTGLDDKTILEALYFHKNKEALISELKTKLETSIAEKKSVEAFQKVGDLYNNIGGAAQQQNGQNATLEITEVKGRANSSGW